ncbi:hypothetical protein CHS0354_028151, partial [Potamilus streckersoni]
MCYLIDESGYIQVASADKFLDDNTVMNKLLMVAIMVTTVMVMIFFWQRLLYLTLDVFRINQWPNLGWMGAELGWVRTTPGDIIKG